MWLSELGVGWVLDLSDDLSAGTSFLRDQPLRNNLTGSWIRALTDIMKSTCLMTIHCYHWVLLMEATFMGREQDVLLVRFVKAAVLKMTPFVDALLAAVDPDAGTDTADATVGTPVLSADKLQTLLDVRGAVSSASEGIQQCSRYWDFLEGTESHRSCDEVLSLLSAKEQRLDEAIWNTMEEVRTSILNDDDETRWGIQSPQESSGTCKVTRSLIDYIKCLWNNCCRLNRIACTAAKLGSYVLEHGTSSSLLTAEQQDKADPLTSLIMEMVSSLQVKLAKRSEAFPDHSLRFLFLINNTHFIWQHLHPLFPKETHLTVLTAKIENNIQKYLQVSWEPVLSCLHNHTPHYCFSTNSTLPRFDSEFQKTYTAQKLWKVPDPGLRTRLRKAIVEKVVSGLTRYLEDNNVTNPGVTLQEQEEMLLELFEG